MTPKANTKRLVKRIIEVIQRYYFNEVGHIGNERNDINVKWPRS